MPALLSSIQNTNEFNHFNTKLVWNSDSHCNCILQEKNVEQERMQRDASGVHDASPRVEGLTLDPARLKEAIEADR